MENEKNADDEKKALNNHMDDSAAAVDISDIMNDSKAKFINGANGASLEVEIVDSDRDKKSSEDEFVGLTKDELLQYAKDPFWVRVRIILMVIFAVVWVLMLVAAIIIIVVAPKCPPRPTLEWYQKSIIYHIHPQSFFDTNMNGYGDVNGIHEKLDYLKNELDVDVLCVGPMNPTPNFEYGYNINNYNMICPGHYGNAEDFDGLLAAMHKKEMKLLLDFIPNHTSLKHPWFINSSKSQDTNSMYHNFYVWHPGRSDASGKKSPPNDWLTVYGTPAWTYHDERGEYYYHAYSKDEPDLNLRNPAVIAKLDESLMYWLRHDVSGFRFYGVQYLVESANVTQASGEAIDNPTQFQPESYELVTHWRELLNNFSHNDGKSKSRYYPRLMIADVDGTTNETVSFMKYGEKDGAQIATNVLLTNIEKGCDARCVRDLVYQWTSVTTDRDGITSNWQTGSVTKSRVASRMDDIRYINAINMLLLTLPGTPLVYYGEEIGMKNVSIDAADCDDSSIVGNLCRVVNRSPMQWTDQKFAGFTTGNKTWIPVSNNYHGTNVEAQLAHGAGISSLFVFKTVSKLRQEPSFQWGQFHPTVSGNILFYSRQAEGFDGYLVALNLGAKPSSVGFAGTVAMDEFKVPDEGEVVATTGHFTGPGRANEFTNGTIAKLSNVRLEAGEGVIFKWSAESVFESQ